MHVGEEGKKESQKSAGVFTLTAEIPPPPLPTSPPLTHPPLDTLPKNELKAMQQAGPLLQKRKGGG